jgi:hypothetical protein
MPFPQTIDELRRAGYKYENDAKCRTCGADIEWWISPNNKKIPMDHGTAIAHFTTCPDADQHRSKPAPTSKITTATLDMEWIKKEAAKCFCTVCKKLTGR